MTVEISNADVVANQCQALAALIAQHTDVSSSNLFHPTAIAPLSFFRADTASAVMYQDYEPCFAILAQGKKDIILGEETHPFEAGHCLVVSVDLPVSACIIEATPNQPYLGLKLTLDPIQLCEIVAQMPLNFSLRKKENSVRGLSVSNADTTLLDCALRLTKLLDTPQDVSMLAPMIIWEIYYRLLSGEQSEAVRQIATSGSGMQRISKAIEQIKVEFSQPMRVENLAKQARMSTSSFHQHFKQVTSMSPLQYQKQLRLLEARRLMLTEDCDATSAAYQVGYESPSQFSREYSRLFGAPPIRDIERLRTA